MGRSEVRIGPPGEVCVCGGEPGSRGQYRSGSRAMCWGEQSRKCESVTSRIEVSSPHGVSSTFRRADTQISQCLAETAFSRKSKLTMFDVRRLCWENCCQTQVEFFCPPLVPFLYIWSWLSTSLPCTQSGIKSFCVWTFSLIEMLSHDCLFSQGDPNRIGAPSKASRGPNCLCLRVLTVHVGARVHPCL